MFSFKASSKIKNEKILCWRLELSCFKFDIMYRPGRDNIPADALSQICSAVGCNNPDIRKLETYHIELCHPGVSRLYHWVKTKNLPFSVDYVRTICSRCTICSELKPRFYCSTGHVIKATRPMERLSIDF